jgi:hypothetical protein
MYGKVSDMIYFSYLHATGKEWAELLAVDLGRHLARDWILVDSSRTLNAPGSSDWRKRFLRLLCSPPPSILVAVIDPEWSGVLVARNKRNDAPFVSMELTWACRSETPIVPVLTPGAKWPKRLKRMPEGAAEMLRGEGNVATALELGAETWEKDVLQLATVLKAEASSQEAATEAAHRRGHPTRGEAVVLTLLDDVDEKREYLRSIGLLSVEQVNALRQLEENSQRDLSVVDRVRRAVDMVPRKMGDRSGSLTENFPSELSMPSWMTRKEKKRLYKLIESGGFELPPDQKPWPRP